MTTNMYINELDLHQSMYVAKTMCSEEKGFICVNSYIITVNFLLISKIHEIEENEKLLIRNFNSA